MCSRRAQEPQNTRATLEYLLLAGVHPFEPGSAMRAAAFDFLATNRLMAMEGLVTLVARGVDVPFDDCAHLERVLVRLGLGLDPANKSPAYLCLDARPRSPREEDLEFDGEQLYRPRAETWQAHAVSLGVDIDEVNILDAFHLYNRLCLARRHESLVWPDDIPDALAERVCNHWDAPQLVRDYLARCYHLDVPEASNDVGFVLRVCCTRARLTPNQKESLATLAFAVTKQPQSAAGFLMSLGAPEQFGAVIRKNMERQRMIFDEGLRKLARDVPVDRCN